MMPLFSGRSEDGTCVTDLYPKDNNLIYFWGWVYSVFKK